MTKKQKNVETVDSIVEETIIENTIEITENVETVDSIVEETIIENTIEITENVIEEPIVDVIETPVETTVDVIEETIVEEKSIINGLLNTETAGIREYVNQSYSPDVRMLEMLRKFKNVYISYDNQIIYSGPSTFVNVNKKTIEIHAKHYPLRGLVIKPF